MSVILAHGDGRQERRAIPKRSEFFVVTVGNVLLFAKQPTKTSDPTIKRRKRLGGLLSFYHREAA